MKTTLITTFTIFASALALPNIRPANTYPLATLQLANDLTGANAIRSLPANAVPTTFAALFAGSALIKNGVLKATSLQNVAPGAGVTCTVKKAGGEVVGSVNAQTTWVDLDGVKERAVETDVAGWTVGCE